MGVLLCLLASVPSWPGRQALAQRPPSRIVYFTTFTHGLSGWSGTTGTWRRSKQFISTDQRGVTVVIAPFVVRMKSYAVQSKLRIVAWRNRGSGDALVGILFRAPSKVTFNKRRMTTGQGLVSGLYRLQGTTNVSVKQAYELGSLWGQQTRYDPGQGFHTYRVEVRGSRIRVLVDGRQKLSLSWNDSARGTRVGIAVTYAAVQVKGFRVTTL